MSKLDGTIDFREPTEDEKSARGAKFVGLILSIFWDGDDAYYPCEVTGYDATSLQHTVRYFNANNEDEAKATEDFSSTLWKIWPGSKDQYLSLHPETKVSPTICIYNLFFELYDIILFIFNCRNGKRNWQNPKLLPR